MSPSAELVVALVPWFGASTAAMVAAGRHFRAADGIRGRRECVTLAPMAGDHAGGE